MDYDWVEREINGILTTRRKRRIQSGIDHLPNKKLYKYYSFSSEYTLSNIENDLIYLQNPIEFNDPFDCNIGISAGQLIHTFAPNIIDKLLPNTDASVKSLLLSCIFGGPATDLPDNSKEKLVSLLVNNPIFIDLLKKAQRGEEVTKEDCAALIVSDTKLMCEVVKAVLLPEGGDGSFSFDETDLQEIAQTPQIVRALIAGIATPQNDDEAGIIGLLTSDEDFLTKIESFIGRFGLNMSRDNIQIAYNNLSNSIKQIREKFGEIIGIECFTESPTDVLMWSYYANKHSGICVEYDFSRLFSSLSDAYLFPVIYSENRPLLNLMDLYDPKTQAIVQEGLRKEFPNIVRSFITKSSEWEREKEWRIISLSINNDCPNRTAKLPIISKIITGLNIKEEDYQKIKEIATRKGIPMQRAQLNNERYRIELVDDQ